MAGKVALCLKSITHVSPKLPTCCGLISDTANKFVTSCCNGIWETTRDTTDTTDFCPRQLVYVADLLQTCCGLVTDLLRGNWCNGFWCLVCRHPISSMARTSRWPGRQGPPIAAAGLVSRGHPKTKNVHTKRINSGSLHFVYCMACIKYQLNQMKFIKSRRTKVVTNTAITVTQHDTLK